MVAITPGPTRGMVILFMASVFIAFGLVLGGTWYAVVQAEHSAHQWCDTLDLLTSQPVTPPADPAANPSREGQYKLYEDFVHLKAEFGC